MCQRLVQKDLNNISDECKVKYFLTMIDVTAPLLTREEAHSLTPVLKEGVKKIKQHFITQQEGEYMKIRSEKKKKNTLFNSHQLNYTAHTNSVAAHQDLNQSITPENYCLTKK